MPDPPFVHLHVHTHYSLLDGATRIVALMDRARAFDMPAVAITDHGNLFGAIEFYEAAKRAGIKPIIGCETYLASGHRRERDAGNGKEAYHLLLLAMNLEGYRNLVRLATIGYLEGFYRKPRIDKQVLREHAAGLLCTSTCIGGEIPQAFLHRDAATARRLAETYLDIFGPDRFFIELQDHRLPEQRTINPELIDLADRLGVGLIATNDVHYLEHEDVEAHDVLCCINTGSLVREEDRFKFPSDQFYFKSPREMAELFPDCPEALANTLRVAELCNLELDLKKRFAPVFQVPDSLVNDSGQRLDDAEYLRRLVYEGAEERYGDVSPELRERIDYELDVITSKGFASYFLIVWDCVNDARRQGIPAGARGSGCSSVVAYCLHISAPDPIRYGLYFERFMDPDRDEMPDIDLDICQNGRALVLEYVRQKYGHVAQIITFGTLKAKAAVKDVARVMGLGFDEANQITKLIPGDLKMTLDRALQQEPELKKRYLGDDRVRRVIDVARRLEGVARNAGIHAAGVVVADQPLVNFLPLYQAPGQEAAITQFDGPTAEKVGLLKMDFLGLRTLTTLERARQLAERSSGRAIELERLDLSDPNVYDLFARGDTKGIFQFESGGMRDVILRMKPNRIEDLIAANALYRPGPMEYIPDYIARKHGKSWTTPHPIMTEVLEETYGIMVYQEQVSRVVNRLGGIELKAAFRLAKAISKKKTEMIEAMREPFLQGCAGNGVRRAVATQVFEDILKFGGYAFNKAHSTGYALIAYQTAWMKTYFPVEFMAALMTFEMSNSDKVAEYREACQQMGIKIEPPCINASDMDFVVERAAPRAAASTATTAVPPSGNGQGSARTAPHQASSNPVHGSGFTLPTSQSSDHSAGGPAIRFGLGAIKGLGAKAVAAIIAERDRGGRFRSLFDFCERVDLSVINRGTLESLVCAGGFDRSGAMRKALLDALDRALEWGQTVQQDRRAGQMGLFATLPGQTPSEPPLGREEWPEAEMLAREKATLGFYITRHPLATHEKLLAACATATTADLERFSDGDPVVVGGMVSSLRTVLARGGRNPGKRLGVVTLEDLSGHVSAIVFPDDLATYRPVLVPDAVLFFEGAVDRKREEPSIRVSRIVTHEQAVEVFAKALILTVQPGGPVENLVELLRAHRGECEVYLTVPVDGEYVAQVQSHPSLRVRCSPLLIAGCTNLLGVSSVCVLGPARKAIPLDAIRRLGAPVST